jgi:hypothetical protein
MHCIARGGRAAGRSNHAWATQMHMLATGAQGVPWCISCRAYCQLSCCVGTQLPSTILNNGPGQRGGQGEGRALTCNPLRSAHGLYMYSQVDRTHCVHCFFGCVFSSATSWSLFFARYCSVSVSLSVLHSSMAWQVLEHVHACVVSCLYLCGSSQ